MDDVTAPGTPVRVAIVDDDALVRSGLALILGGADTIEVVGQAEDGERALALLGTAQPDVVLMDIRMPVLDGLAATEQIRAGLGEDDAPRVIVLTTFDADEYVLRALAAGASGFLLKDTPPTEIVAAIEAVAAGEPMLSPTVLSGLIRHVTARPGDGLAAARSRLELLTERETDVARAVGRGLSNADIGRELYLSVPTVKAHIGRLLTKLDLENRVQIAILVHDARLDET